MLVWQAHKNWVRRIVFLGNSGKVATTAGFSRFVWIWDAGTQELVAKLNAHHNPPAAPARWMPTDHSVHVMAASADGTRLATLNNHFVVKVWDAASGAELRQWSLGGEGHALAVSPDGRAVATSRWAAGVESWPLDDGDSPDRVPTSKSLVGVPAFALAYSPDGKWLAAHRGDNMITLWPTETPHRFSRPAPPIEGAGLYPGALAFSPDSRHLAAVRGTKVHLWERERWAAGPVVAGDGKPVYDLAFSPDSRSLLAVGKAGTVRVYDVGTGEERRALDFGIGEVRAAAFSPDGLTAAVGGEKGQIVVWDVDG